MDSILSEAYICELCGNTVSKIVKYKGRHLCAECAERSDPKKYTKIWNKMTAGKYKNCVLHTPEEICTYADRFVIGQQEAKAVLSVAVYNHRKRLFNSKLLSASPIRKSNVLLIGPTGCGKTHLVHTIAKMMDVPFAAADATSLTEAGYVGDDVENILLRLYESSGCDLEKTERGIIYIDEFDKIGMRGENTSITRDVGGEGVQQALLRIIEGTKSSVPLAGGRKHPYGENIEIDTTNILFICGGAFVGLEEIIQKRLGCSQKNMGFGACIEEQTVEKAKNHLHLVEPEDLIKFGMLPELIGRLPVITALDPLDEDMLTAILTRPDDAICKEYQQIFRLDGCELEFQPEAIREIARIAIERKCGARGLRTIVERTLSPTMFFLPQIFNKARVIVTPESVRGETPPIIQKKQKPKTA